MPANATIVALPKEWPKRIRTAVLSVISLARLALIAARGQAARSRKAHARLRAELEAARGEIALLEREIEIKDLRMSRVLPLLPHSTVVSSFLPAAMDLRMAPARRPNAGRCRDR